MPAGFSDVFVRGTQLMVRRRQVDGSLGEAQPYLIKGIAWSPATRAPIDGFDPRSLGRAPYGFFFDGDWRAPGLPGHDLLRYWQQDQFTTRHAADLALIAQLHANTVRVYTDLGNTPADGLRVLDECYRRGLMVILTVAASKDDRDAGRHLALVRQYKAHPAILMWVLGNEWNLNRYYGYTTLDQAITATQQMADAIAREDPNHPVSSVLADQPNNFRTITQRVPAVGVWGLNVYRGAGFGNLVAQWTGATTKPLYLSEFGTDSFRTQRYQLYNGNEAINVVGSIDEAMQQSFDLKLWKELVPFLSVVDARQPCLGGFVFEFNDELWKVGSFHVGLGRPASYYDGRDLQPGTIDDNTSYDDYDAEGFLLRGQHPDHVGNEEYFGLVDADRRPKAAYTALAQFYGQLTGPVTPVNHPPVIEPIPNQTVRVGEAKTFPGLLRFSDPEGLIPAFVVVKGGPNGLVVRPSPTAPGAADVFWPAVSSPGIYNLTAIVPDPQQGDLNGSLAARLPFTVTVVQSPALQRNSLNRTHG